MQLDLYLFGVQLLGVDQVCDWLCQCVFDVYVWWMLLLSEWVFYWNVGWELCDGSEFKVFQLDVVSGQLLLKIVGGEFFFILYYDLYVGMVGLYIVGIVGMLMLVVLVSGIIVYWWIFKDFFILCLQVVWQCVWFDVYNVLGVIGLLFYLMIVYIGLVIFIVYYMQVGLQVVYQNDGECFFYEVQGFYECEEVGCLVGLLVFIDGLIVEVGKVWGDGGVLGWISVYYFYDEVVIVDICWCDVLCIFDDQCMVNFDVFSGELLYVQLFYVFGYVIYGWLIGLYMIQWGGQLVCWMYLLFGLFGVMMIFGGLQVWLVKCEVCGSCGVGLVWVLNLVVCGGLLLVSLVLLWGNCLLLM